MQQSRPTIGEISKQLRENPDRFWIDQLGRIYGIIHLSEDKTIAKCWVLLPRPRSRKRYESVVFPLPNVDIDLSIYVRPKSPPQLTLRIRRYVTRPRRQRAASLIVSLTKIE